MQQKMEKNALMVAWCCKSPEVYGGLGGPSALLKLFWQGYLYRITFLKRQLACQPLVKMNCRLKAL